VRLPRAYLAKLLEDNPVIKKVRGTVLNFRRLMKEKEGDKLAAWCNEVINDENENIKGFTRSILGRAAFRIFKPFTKGLYQIGVMVQSKAKSTGSKQLSDRCTGVQVLSYSENEWSSPVKDSLSPKLTKNQICVHFSTMKRYVTLQAIVYFKKSLKLQS
jgi:hypothetical protein